MAKCPFCYSAVYNEHSLKCSGCDGTIVERMYCPVEDDYCTFTLEGERLGCWSCQTVFDSQYHYDTYTQDKYGKRQVI